MYLLFKIATILWQHIIVTRVFVTTAPLETTQDE